MNVISGASNEFKFKKTDHIFSAIKSDLHLYQDLGLIDESKFYRKIKRFLEELGTAIYKEKHAMILVEKFVATLLTDFSLLYAAYKCKGDSTSKSVSKHFQNGWSFWVEDELQKYKENKACLENGCWDDKINYRIRSYIGIEEKTSTFSELTLLSVTNRVWNLCDINCLSMSSSNLDEISLDIQSEKIITNFNDGFIYLQYWAFLYDENGLLMILDNAIIEGAVEDFVKYKIFEEILLNNNTQDVERRYVMLKQDSFTSKKLALYYVNLPSFQNMVQAANNNRNKFDKFQMGDNRRRMLNEYLDNLNILSASNHLAFYNLYTSNSEIYPKR